MNKIKIAITGGIGSGKTLAADYLRGRGYTVFSCDDIYKEVIVTKVYLEAIRQIFPTAIDKNGLNRKILAEIIFNNPEKRNQLNQVAHPMILKNLLSKMDICEDALVFAEVPLLFEGGFENLFDKIIVIYRDKMQRIKAIQARDGLSLLEIEGRMCAQYDYNSAEGRAYIQTCNAIFIENDNSAEELYAKIEETIQNMV